MGAGNACGQREDGVCGRREAGIERQQLYAARDVEGQHAAALSCPLRVCADLDVLGCFLVGGGAGIWSS